MELEFVILPVWFEATTQRSRSDSLLSIEGVKEKVVRESTHKVEPVTFSPMSVVVPIEE